MADGIDEHGLPIWPAAERNKEPIAEELARRLPASGRLLEVASGTGQHAAFFTERLPGWTIQPTDADPTHLRTLEARRRVVDHPRLLPPIALDVTASWPELDAVDAVYCANMIHIAPWAACLGLFRGASRLAVEGGRLFLYGPFRLDGRHHAPSNAEFDASLRARDERYGVRDLEEVRGAAREAGFSFEELVSMPANNHLVVFRR